MRSSATAGGWFFPCSRARRRALGCDWPRCVPPGAAPLRYRDRIFTQVVKTPDIEYGTAVNLDQQTVHLKLDLYRPQGDTLTSRPAIVWVHGGSFSSLDKTSGELVDEAQTFSKKGYVNASIDYRLDAQGCSAAVPTGRCVDAIRQAMEDAQTAVRFLKAHAADYGIDTTRIAIGGSSAGAITALNVGYASAENPDSKVRAAVSLSGANLLSKENEGDAVAVHSVDDPLVPYSRAAGTVRTRRRRSSSVLTTRQHDGHVPYAQHHDQIIDQTQLPLLAMDLPHAAEMTAAVSARQ